MRKLQRLVEETGEHAETEKSTRSNMLCCLRQGARLISISNNARGEPSCRDLGTKQIEYNAPLPRPSLSVLGYGVLRCSSLSEAGSVQSGHGDGTLYDGYVSAEMAIIQ